MSALSAPYLHNEAAAFVSVESVLWPNGPVCPRCGGQERITKVKANPDKGIREGLYRCGPCKRQFTVKVGTIFEDSNVKMHLWVQTIVLMTASKKVISAHQLHRTLGVTYKTAWSMGHRVREAMRSGDLAPFGSVYRFRLPATRSVLLHAQIKRSSPPGFRGPPLCLKKHLHRYAAEFEFRYKAASPTVWTTMGARALPSQVPRAKG